MKRIISFLLAIFMAFFTVPVAKAESSTPWPDGPHVNISSSINDEGNVIVKVDLSAYTNLFGLQFDVTYNYELVEIGTIQYEGETYYQIETGDITDNRPYGKAASKPGSFENHANEGYLRYLFSADTGKKYTGTGADNILIITFKAKDGASGTADFEITNAKFVQPADSEKVVPTKEGNEGGTSKTSQTIKGIINAEIPLNGSYSEIKRGETASSNITSTNQNVNVAFEWGAKLSDGKFAANTTYTPIITITPKEGYEFGESASASYNSKAGVKADQTITITLDSVKTNDVTGNIELNSSDYTKPAKGITAAGTFTSANNNVTIGTINWGAGLDANDKFKANTTYSPTITLTAKNGFDFADANVTFGSVAITKELSADGKTMTVKFPSVTTEDKEIKSIALSTTTQTPEIQVNSTFAEFVTANGFKVTATYDDTSTGELSSDQYTSDVQKFEQKGTKTVTITAGGQKATLDVKVNPLSRDITFTDPSLTYNGQSQKEAVENAISYDGDGTRTISDLSEVINAGAYTFHVSVTGSATYADIENKEIKFNVAKKAIAESDFNDIEAQSYTGEQIKPTVSAKTSTIGNKLSYTYGTNVNAGTGTVTIKADDDNQNYTGEITKGFTINPIVLGVSNVMIKSGNTTKEYDGTNTVTALVFAIKDTVASLNGTELSGTASYNSADVNNNVKIIFNPDAVTSGNYTISSEIHPEFDGAITAVTSEHIVDKTRPSSEESPISIAKATGVFPDAAFGWQGHDDVTPAGTISYSYEGATTKEEIQNALKNLPKDTVAQITYSYSGEGNFAGAEKTGTMYVKIADIQFKLEDGTDVTDDNAVTKKSNPVYGDNWDELVTVNKIIPGMQTADEYVTGAGNFSVVSTDVLTAGTKTYEVLFTGTVNGIEFSNIKVASGTVTLAKKPLTVDNLENKTVTKEYDGTTTCAETTLKVVSGLVNGDSNVTVSGTTVYDGAGVNTTTATFTVNADGSVSNDNYIVSGGTQPTTKSLTAKITKKAVTITASEQTIVYGTEISKEVGKAVLADAIEGATLDTVTLSTTQTNVGEYEKGITASMATIKKNEEDITANFNISYVAGKLTITKAQNSITGNPTIEGWTYGDAPKNPSGSSSNFGTVKYKYISPDSQEQNAMHATDNAGTWQVVAYVEGTENYEAAQSEPVSFTIAKAPLTVTYPTTEITNVDDFPGAETGLKAEGMKNGDQFDPTGIALILPHIETVVNSHGETVKRTGEYTVGLGKGTWSSPNYEITEMPEQTAVKVNYKVIAGANETWRKGSSAGKTITSNSDFADKFSKVLMDGEEVAAENYEAKDGSIVVDFKATYLEKLALGEHKVEIASIDGSAFTTLTILPKEAPKPSGGSDDKKTPSSSNVVTCQDAGYPADYAWNEAAKACQPGYIDNNGVFHANNSRTNGRRGVANTTDKGLGSWIVMFLTSGLMAIAAAYTMKKYK